MKRSPATIPAPITAPVVHYEGSQLRRVLWVLAIIQALRLAYELIT